MCSNCTVLLGEIADLERYAADLVEAIHDRDDGLARALNTDAAGVSRFLYSGPDRYVPYRVSSSPLDEQLVRSKEETMELLEAV